MERTLLLFLFKWKPKLRLMSVTFYSAFSFIQNSQAISGKITDAGEVGIPGVTVKIEITSIGVTTNLEGDYRLNIPAGQQKATLVFSFVGFKTQQFLLDNRSVINDVALTEDSKQLKEVIVVEFGSELKAEVSGSVQTISSEEMEEIPSALVT